MTHARVNGNAQPQDGQKTLSEDTATLICMKHGEYPVYRPSFSGEMIPQPYCPVCRREEIAGRDKIAREHALREKIATNKKQCGVPRRYEGKTLVDVKETETASRALRWLRRYLEVLPECLKKGVSGSLCGDCGTGKTLMGCALVNAAIAAGYRARYITAWQMIQDIRHAYGASDLTTVGQVSHYVSAIDLLVIDEIGVQAGSQDERVLMYQVIDGRYNALRSTVLISNLKKPVEDGFLDARTIDRLREDGGFSLILTGDSYRGQNADS